MISSSTLISDVKSEFEGGNSLSVSWDSLVVRAVRNMLQEVRPETLKRTVPIYGGLADEVNMYYCPDNVYVPSDIYFNFDRTNVFSYTSPRQFHHDQKYNKYTIETINGIKFIMIRHSLGVGSLTIDSMEAVGTKTGGSVALNSNNYLIGSNSIEATFTDAGITLSDTLTTALDITAYLNGVVILPAFLSDATKLSSIEIRLETDASNYYSVISTADSIGDYFTNGWNMIKFEMGNASETGSPDSTDITQWKIIGTTTSGQTLTIQFDKFTIQKMRAFTFEYYTHAAFVNATTSAKWQTAFSNGRNDSINMPYEAQNILHYELCLLVLQSATFEKVDSAMSKKFEGQLRRAYDRYFEVYPSNEEPMSYSISPDIPREADWDTFRLQDNTPIIT